jgi:hypothetical protein
MDKQHGKDIQDGHGHAAWTRTCSMDMDLQLGYEHAAWTLTCGHGKYIDLDMEKTWT